MAPYQILCIITVPYNTFLIWILTTFHLESKLCFWVYACFCQNHGELYYQYTVCEVFFLLLLFCCWTVPRTYWNNQNFILRSIRDKRSRNLSTYTNALTRSFVRITLSSHSQCVCGKINRYTERTRVALCENVRTFVFFLQLSRKWREKDVSIYCDLLFCLIWIDEVINLGIVWIASFFECECDMTEWLRLRVF